MLSTLFERPQTRRSRLKPTTRRRAKSRRPSVEPMEARQLLSGLPYILVNSTGGKEGTGGSTTMNFTVNLSNPSNVPVTVDYQTADGTAQAGSDYTATSGTLTFNPGETSKNIPVSIVADSNVEQNETFYMNLSNTPVGTIIASRGVATIIDDDTAVAPLLSINDVAQARGTGGPSTMLFTVSLNAPQSVPVTVNASTSDVTAVAGVDYQATSQDLTFNPGETTKQLAVTIYGTSALTPTKVFFVSLNGANVPYYRKTGAGIINWGA
jgi:hypothetical protein